jgi:hypothetical protein
MHERFFRELPPEEDWDDDEDEDDCGLTEYRLLRAMRVASKEGRLNPVDALLLKLPTGTYECPMCGMLAYTFREAEDCCTTPDRLGGLTAGRSKCCYAGVIVDRGRFVGALEGVLFATEVPWHPDFKMPRDCLRSLKNRVKTEETGWITAGTWEDLMVLFGPDIPGCVPIADTWPKGKE